MSEDPGDSAGQSADAEPEVTPDAEGTANPEPELYPEQDLEAELEGSGDAFDERDDALSSQKAASDESEDMDDSMIAENADDEIPKPDLEDIGADDTQQRRNRRAYPRGRKRGVRRPPHPPRSPPARRGGRRPRSGTREMPIIVQPVLHLEDAIPECPLPPDDRHWFLWAIGSTPLFGEPC
jgi:hypothetical protein